MTLRMILIGLCSIVCMSFMVAQEICDNGVDDDFDGLIDLYDDDCKCEILLSSSLIPNPSFEERTCCPDENARLDCAVGWIQASHPTTDYVHMCGGYLGNTNIPAFAPLPFPDGEGAVGFRDGQNWVGPNYKEYVGTCLNSTMIPGTKYKLDFFVGFRNNIHGSTELNMAIFGSTKCENLPFGGNSNDIGCPLNSGNYVQLGELRVTGSNEWVNVEFEFEADLPYEVIILGPGCDANPNYIYDPYFYLDRLVLAESSDYEIPFENIEGNICNGGVTLSVESIQDHYYQWYKNEKALVGEIESKIHLIEGKGVNGIYKCMISNEYGCSLSSEYELRIPPYTETTSATICENDLFFFGDEILTESGSYENIMEAADGCDSIVILDLTVSSTSQHEIIDTICEGEYYSFFNMQISQGGDYENVLLNHNGCDSILNLKLTEIPRGTSISMRDTFEISLGESIDLYPNYLDPDYFAFQWKNQDGSFSSESKVLEDLIPTNSEYYYFNALDQYGCPVMDSTLVLIRERNHDIYAPNVFSPNNDGINDKFNFIMPASADQILTFGIYDRWGNLVYQEENIDNGNNDWGWNGSFKEMEALNGVYAYFAMVRFIDGEEKLFTGDLTLLR